MKVEEMKKMLRGEGRSNEKDRVLLSSGSTLLNLACSGNVNGAFATGHYYFFCGDSQCGKTWMGMSAFAEASIDPKFDDYRLIYDPVEHGALMDMERFFGERAAKRIEVLNPPSEMAEEFYYNVDDVLSDGQPFIYVLDSQDSLSSVAELKKFGERKEAHRKGKETSGSFEASKPKIHSGNIRTLMTPLEKSGSILIVLNQTRDSFDPFKPKSYSGGRSLKFYATIQLWGSVGKRVEKTVRGRKVEQGKIVKIAVRKNRIEGKERTIEFPILHSHGIDDVGSMVRFMVNWKEWTESKGKIVAKGLGPPFSGTLDAVVKRIEEEEDLVDDLKDLVQRTWNEVEAACVAKRKRRYE
jgi:RecA/RadA recombinase